MLKSLLSRYTSLYFPKFFIQKMKMGDVYFCTLSDNSPVKGSVFTSFSCGAGDTWEESLLKAQSEFVERKALKEAKVQSSTGFAAYPYFFLKKLAKKKAMKNAFLEMLERYSWPEWFYNLKIAYKFSNIVSKENRIFFEDFQKDIKIQKLYRISPNLENKQVSMVILYAETKDGLVCASATKSTEKEAEQNALKELYMHATALYRMKKNKIKPSTSYENRVLWISGQKKRLEKRLEQKGTLEIDIPFPIKYQDIKTEYDKAYIVQRCIFEGYNKEFFSKENEMYV